MGKKLELYERAAIARANAKGKTDELLDLAANVVVAHRELNDDNFGSHVILEGSMKRLEMFLMNLAKED